MEYGRVGSPCVQACVGRVDFVLFMSISYVIPIGTF